MNIHSILNKSFVNFVTTSKNLSSKKIKKIKSIVYSDNSLNNDIVINYQNKFSKLIGKGQCVSFGSGRMAFFSLMHVLGIKKGDEVVIQSANCSVMANAIIRTGARPVFADIDIKTLGTSPNSVKSLINKKTKLIVAQHSFGIPCEIDKIVKIGKNNNIFVLEDCALTIGSLYKKKKVGNWGDAALFSTDHTKPINTLIGGILYTNNFKLNSKITKYNQDLPNFSKDHQISLFKKYLFENKYFIYGQYYKGNFIIKVLNLLFRFKKLNQVFLDQDSGYPSNFKNKNYPYPAKIPVFLALIGIYELKNWKNEIIKKQKMLKNYIKVFEMSGNKKLLPMAYFNNDKIVPSRLVFFSNNINKAYKYFRKHYSVDDSWFRSPLIGCSNPKELGYKYGTCIIAEKNSKEIINFPINTNKDYEKNLIYKLSFFLNNK